MNITSFADNNIEQSNKLYSCLHENLEDFYEISLKCQRVWDKIRLVGLEHRYIKSESGDLNLAKLVSNISKGIKWRGFSVVYVPSGVDVIELKLEKKVNSPKIILLGPGAPVSVKIKSDWSSITHYNQVKELILAFDLSNVTNLEDSISYHQELEKVTIYGMVYNLEHKLTQRFHPTHIGDVFAWCERLIELIVVDTDYTQLTDVSNAFYRCSRLCSIYLKGIEEQQEIYLSKAFNTFAFCERLEYLDLRKFRILPRNMGSTFDGCIRLKQIKTEGFSTDDIFDMTVFKNCKQLQSTGMPNVDAEFRRRGPGYYYTG